MNRIMGKWLALSVLPILCLVQAAHADSGDVYSPGMSSSVDLGRYHTDFSYADGGHQADISRYDITFVQPVSSEVGFGLTGGYMSASVNNSTLYSLGDGYGPFLGMFAAWQPVSGNYWDLDFHAGYTWHDMRYNGQNQQADLTWYSTFVFMGPALHLWRWRVSAGGYYQHIDGTESDSGTLNSREDFSAQRATGAYLGIAYYLDRTGSVGIFATGGARRGVQLIFKREF